VLFVPAGVTRGDLRARVGSAFEPVDVRRGVYLCTIALYYFLCTIALKSLLSLT